MSKQKCIKICGVTHEQTNSKGDLYMFVHKTLIMGDRFYGITYYFDPEEGQAISKKDKPKYVMNIMVSETEFDHLIIFDNTCIRDLGYILTYSPNELNIYIIEGARENEPLGHSLFRAEQVQRSTFTVPKVPDGEVSSALYHSLRDMESIIEIGWYSSSFPDDVLVYAEYADGKVTYTD